MTKKTVHSHASPEALVNFRPDVSDQMREYYDGGRFKMDHRWFGFDTPVATRADALSRVTRELATGWSEGAALIERAREAITGTLTAPLNTRVKPVGGYEVGNRPALTRALNGQPGAFSRWERFSKPAAITIVCDLAASAHINAADLVWRGAAALVLADLCESAGYRVEIVGTDVTTHVRRDDRLLVSVNVKRADQPTLPDYLASVLCSPRLYRTCIVSDHCATHDDQSGGVPCNVTPEDLEALGIPLDSIRVPKDLTSRAAAIAWVNAEVAKVNHSL